MPTKPIKERTVLVTGTAGFIGNHLALRLLQDGARVIGLDNVNAYYDVRLKEARLDRLTPYEGFTEVRADLEDAEGMAALFAEHEPDIVIHLAAQAGVRYSLEAPFDYVSSNITGFLSVLEACRHRRPEHLIYASTSSVYGLNGRMPFTVHDGTAHQVSLYAATKRGNEAMAHSYAHLFAVPVTGLRFFTVYGPWGRPDMALFKFARAILAGEPIEIYNHGRMKRDFTYVGDIVENIVRLIDHAPAPDPDWDAMAPDPATSPTGPYRLFNIGNAQPENLMRYVEVLEQALGREADKRFLDMQPGDVAETWADVEDLVATTGHRPATSIEDGVSAFVTWYRDYYGV